MTEPKTYYFYLWRHRFVDDADNIISRTCFGITGNPANRTQGYEGHVGHVVKFAKLWTGPERLIRELESRIKGDFYNQIVTGTNGFRYEWINETVDFDSICRWVEWEVENTFIGISAIE